MASSVTFWAILLAAAVLEVGGDALIRQGLRGGGWFFLITGFLGLGVYGLFVNLSRLDFSRLLGLYVVVFAIVGVLAGRFIFKEKILPSTVLGVTIIVLGGLVIQFGPRFR
jgi:multidrug transporter EmrE-like cation transporter